MKFTTFFNHIVFLAGTSGTRPSIKVIFDATRKTEQWDPGGWDGAFQPHSRDGSASYEIVYLFMNEYFTDSSVEESSNGLKDFADNELRAG